MNVITIKTKSDIENLTGSNLVRFHNEVSKKPTRKFADRKSGLKRSIAAWEAVGSPVVELEVTEAPKAPKAKKVHKAKKEVSGDATPGGRSRKIFDLKPASQIKDHREGTARAKAVAILLKGATFEAVQKATGWTNHRHAYEGIRLLNTHLGYGIREKDGVIEIYS